MIPKEIKYNLHYDDVRGDFLRPPHVKLLDEWQRVYILTKNRIMWHLIRIYTVCAVMSVRMLRVNTVSEILFCNLSDKTLS